MTPSLKEHSLIARSSLHTKHTSSVPSKKLLVVTTTESSPIDRCCGAQRAAQVDSDTLSFYCRYPLQPLLVHATGAVVCLRRGVQRDRRKTSSRPNRWATAADPIIGQGREPGTEETLPHSPQIAANDELQLSVVCRESDGECPHPSGITGRACP